MQSNITYTTKSMLFINMNARLYDPAIGRMLSPDIYVQSPTSTQSYNRYSYCWNNPLKYTDPSGNFFIDPIADIVTSFVSGFVFSGGNIQNRWDAGGNRVENSIRIWGGMFNTDNHKSDLGRAIELFSRFTYEYPQNTFGIAYSQVRNYTGGVSSVDYLRGATVVNNETFRSEWWGVTMGSFINTKDAVTYDGENPNGLPNNLNNGIDMNNGLVRHEYGHVVQSRIAGPLYFYPIMPNSGISAALFLDRHDSRWFERNADFFAELYMSLY